MPKKTKEPVKKLKQTSIKDVLKKKVNFLNYLNVVDVSTDDDVTEQSLASVVSIYYFN